MPTKDLWFMPQSGPGRQYVLDYAFTEDIEAAARAVSIKMFRKYAAGEVASEPLHDVVLAFSTLAWNQIKRSHGAADETLDAFLVKTAERAAACLDLRLPPPLEEPLPAGFVLWLNAGDFASEKALTYTIVKAFG